MLEQWDIFLLVLWVRPEKHSAVYELMIMINAADEELNTRLWAQTHHQPTIMATLVRPIQTGFN